MDKKYVEIDEVRNCIHAVQKYRENLSLAALDLDTDGVMIKILQRIEQIPAADVAEVVRCKNCKNYTDFDVYKCKRFTFHFCKKFMNITKEDDFCSYGERKEGTDDGTVL